MEHRDPFFQMANRRKPQEIKTPKKEGPFSGPLLRQADVLERMLDAENKFLPADHPVTRYAQSRIQPLFPDQPLKIRVSSREEEPNALCLPNGTIILTKGLLRILDTNEEVDFVGGHEGAHYTQGHAQEMKDVVKDAKDRYTVNRKDASGAIRLLGRARLSEYEADIRGIVAMTEGKVNPLAARSVFLKLEQHKQDQHQQGESMAHGTNVGRMVNIAGMAALFDTLATTQEQNPIPEEVKRFSEEPTEQELLSAIIEANSVPEILPLIRSASIPELLLTLRRTRKSFGAAEDDPFRRREMENYAFFQKNVGGVLKEKINQELKGLRGSQKDALLHAVLSLSGGIHQEDDSTAVFDTYTQTLTEFEDEEDLWDTVSAVTPETLTKLGVVIPENRDLSHYIQELIRSANENELFVEEDGSFSIQKYIAFIKKIEIHFKSVAEATCLDEFSLHFSSAAIFHEGVLNLDLKRSPQHLLLLIQEMKAAGIPLNDYETLKIVESLPSVKKGFLSFEEIETEVMGERAYYKIWKEVEPDLSEALKKESGYRGIEVSYTTIEALTRKLQAAFHPKSMEEVEGLLAWLRERTNVSDRRTKGVIEQMLSLYLTNLCRTGADFLPPSASERLTLVTLTTLSAEGRVTSILPKLEDALGSSLPDDPLESIDFLLKLLDIFQGKHPLFKELQRNPPLFICERFNLGSSAPENLVLTTLAVHGYSDLAKFIKNENPSKEKILSILKHLVDTLLVHVDRPPKDEEDSLISALLSTYIFDIENPEDQEILLYLSCTLSNEDQKSRLQDKILQKKMKVASFDEKLSTIFQDNRTKSSLTRRTRERFIEEDAQTPNELTRVEDAIKTQFESLPLAEGIGRSVVNDLVHDLFGTDLKYPKRRLFEYGMETHTSDKDIRKRIFLMEYASSGDVVTAMFETDRIVGSALYMDDVTRLGVIRELFVGTDGLLLNEKSRAWLLELLYRNAVQAPTSSDSVSINTLLREIMGTAIKETDADLIFFMLAPIIHERFFKPPAALTSWEEVLKEARQEKEDIQEALEVYNGKDSSDAILSSSDADDDEERGKNWIAKLIRQNKNFDTLIGKEENERIPETKITVEEFVLKIAESFGAPGVRFLQILGQYIEVPESLNNVFRNVYDDVKRQSKLTSTHTIRREWPEFEEEVSRVIRRRGGGSLMTAYETEMQDGSKRIVKVLNANALLFVKESMRALRKIFDKLIERDPEKYKIAPLVLDEIEHWIIEDIHYERFFETDPAFNESNHGFTAPGHTYKIHIPKSYSPRKDGKDSLYVKMEDFVEGKTLTRKEELGEFDQKQIGSLLVKNYFHQITSTVKLVRGEPQEEQEISLLHADVHPGNFMVFKNEEGEGRVAIIDRNNYIELTETDRAFCVEAFSAQTIEQRAECFLNYVSRNLETELGGEKRTNVLAEMLQQSSQGESFVETIPKFLLLFKRDGIAVPLKLTLLIKNINGLVQIAKQAGFKDLTEAYTYYPEAA